MVRKSALVASVLLVTLFAGTIAEAHVSNVSTSLSINKSPRRAVDAGRKVIIFGDLSSANADCVRNQEITLFRKKRGPDRRLGTDQTDNEGEYRFKIRPRRTRRYYTRFAGSVETSYGHSHTCQASRSRTIRVRVD
jgi:hypothetical protein